MSNKYRILNGDEIKALESNGCRARDWTKVAVCDPFDPARFRNVQFLGTVKLGPLNGEVSTGGNIAKSCGIYNAVIADSEIGALCRIANVGVHLANYLIGDKVVIENVGKIETRPGATFGNGVEVEALNEGGGREVTIFNELSSQFAYLQCVHRYRPTLIEKLNEIAGNYVEKIRSDKGTIGAGAQLVSVGEMIDVAVGPAAVISGASSLVNGTVLSSVDASTLIGAGVIGEDFIVAEGSQVTDGVIITKTFIGQGCKVGRQYSAENCLFFANCEAFHGEGVALFGGPYTVTHHKSTLLIAALTSFYNAGSGTNQSNHMYKLGPVHEGKLERGSKTGSFSYMMWESSLGLFSVLIGKHKVPFDVSAFPFSFIVPSDSGKPRVLPGRNIMTVGTVRDGAKWPARDRRKGSVKRDRINFDVFSPLTIGRMVSACKLLDKLQKESGADEARVFSGGAFIDKPLLRKGNQYYGTAIDMYLLGKVMDRIESVVADGKQAVAKSLAASGGVYDENWVDIGGQMMPAKRLAELHEAVESGAVNDIDSLGRKLDEILDTYEDDEWQFVKKAYKARYGRDIETLTVEQMAADADAYLAARSKYIKAILSDAEKEFGALSRVGYGVDGAAADKDADFTAVRGVIKENKFVKEMLEVLKELEARMGDLKNKIGKLG